MKPTRHTYKESHTNDQLISNFTQILDSRARTHTRAFPQEVQIIELVHNRTNLTI